MNSIDRRNFLKYSTAALAAMSLSNKPAFSESSSSNSKLLKAVQLHMLPKELSDADKFKLAKKCGFDGIEMNADLKQDTKSAQKLGALARENGVPIHSIVFGGWRTPFSDPDPKVIEKGLDGMKKTMANAKASGADTVLLVPAIVTEDVSYTDAYKRSQDNIQKLIPVAEELKITIAVENVWNKFLLSPLEFAQYVDEFNSPYLRAYFDVGNVILFGFSQHWIRTLGSRIAKIHLKDFKRSGYKWTNLLDGDVNWSEVRKALDDIGYNGFMTTELAGGDEKYLTDLASRVQKIIDL